MLLYVRRLISAGVIVSLCLPTASESVPCFASPLRSYLASPSSSFGRTSLVKSNQAHFSSPVHLSKSLVTAERTSVVMASGGSSNEEKGISDANPLRTGIVLLAWVSFIGYAFLYAPGSSADAKALDMELLMELITNPLSTKVTPLFSAIFNALGVMPMVYALLLLPGSRGQKLPTGLFCLASFFLGFFALGPYLAFRRENVVPSMPQPKWLISVLESRLPAFLALFGAVSCLYLATLGGAPLDMASRWSEYVSLFQSQMFVHVSSIDLLILSLMVVDPLREDMERRGWKADPAKLLAFAGVPVLGPCLYLALRPPLQLPKEE